MKTFFQVYTAAPETFAGDVAVYILQQGNWSKEGGLPPALADAVSHLADCGDLFADGDRSVWLYPALMDWKGGRPYTAKRILLIALQCEEANNNAVRENLRLCAGTIAQQVRRLDAEQVLVFAPSGLPLAREEVVRELTQGMVLGGYTFSGYKRTSKDADKKGREKEPAKQTCQVYLHADGLAEKEQHLPVQQAQAIGEAVCAARDMGNQPANRWTPADFAAYAEKLGKKKKIKTTILGKAEMRELGLEAILAVNQGSALPPSLSILEYRTAKKHPTVLLVGKGLTFDSGGISAKPAAGMEDMKFDMCGGAAVMVIMQALAELGTTGVNVIGMVPSTENLSGSAALKPGDVVQHYGGLNSEVVNTDAEGRLILGDAIAYGIAKYKPDAVIDIATLTGAAIVGLGHHYSCLLSNNDLLAERLLAAGEQNGEPLWRLPLAPEYRKQLKSEVADIKNAADRSGGTITAACYLQEFVGSTPWAHLDIAGTAWNFTEKSYVPKGASGTSVRTVLQVLTGWKKLGTER